jgi:hypothetical protein
LGDFSIPAIGGEMALSSYSRGEQFVLVAGGCLIVSLVFFPWHKLPLQAFLFVGGDPTRTALQAPNQLQGTLAFLVTVAMVAQVFMARRSMHANPALARLQPAAGLAVLGLLAWKLASNTTYLSVGAYLGLGFAAGLAYAGLVLAKEGGKRR